MALVVARRFVGGPAEGACGSVVGNAAPRSAIPRGAQAFPGEQPWRASCDRRRTVQWRSKGRAESASRQRGQKQERRRGALQLYRSRFAAALAAELEEEVEAMEKRLRQLPKQRLPTEGFALFELSVRPNGCLYRDLVFRFSSPHERGGVLPSQHQFSQGDMVVISRSNPVDDEGAVMEGVVMERGRRFLKIAIPSYQAKGLNVSSKWRVDLSANRVSYERCMLAMTCFASPELRQGLTGCLALAAPRAAFSNGWKASTKSERSMTFGEGAMAVRGLIMSGEERRWRVGESGTSGRVRPDGFMNEELLSIARSPPSRISGAMFGAHRGRVRAVLQKMGDEVNSSQRSAMEAAFSRRITLWQGPPGTGKTRTLVRFISAFRRSERGQVLACAERADVVTATCVGAGDGVLEDGRFRLCVIDEAPQATEASGLISLVRSGAASVLLVGDAAEVPCTVGFPLLQWRQRARWRLLAVGRGSRGEDEVGEGAVMEAGSPGRQGRSAQSPAKGLFQI